MIEDFLEFNRKYNLIDKSDKLLLSVSGGVDSMVMLDLFIKSDYDIMVGHINHNKRAEESLDDASFIKEYCASKNIDCESIQVEESHWNSNENFQNEARNFRYEWLSLIAKKHHCTKVATAHHTSDGLETFIAHFMRGSSLKGLAGIERYSGNLIRPLLFATKEQIENYALLQAIPFRQDPTNNELIYNRNIIRHEVIPSLLKIHPNNFKGFHKTIDNLNDNKLLFLSLLDQVYKSFVSEKKHWTEVNLKTLRNINEYQSILFQFLQKFGFNKDSSDSSLLLNNGQSISSKTFLITKHNDLLLIKRRVQEEPFFLEFTEETLIDCHGFGSLSVSFLDQSKFTCETEIELIRKAMWQGKRVIRNVRDDDVFQPIGMNGEKKNVMKFLRDIDLNPFQRIRTLVLEVDGIICWVIGYRLDERFKLKTKNESTYQLKWESSND